MYEILKKIRLNDNVEEMEIYAPFTAKRAKPGQFLILMVKEDGERIPLTIVASNKEKESISIIYQNVGYTTNLLWNKKEKDALYAVAGPLGKAIEINLENKKILGVAGGVGAAPIYPQLKAYKAKNNTVDLILGARNKDFLILESKFKDVVDNLYLCTDDGSKGEKGFVTNKLKSLAEKNNYDLVITIGPLRMMKAVVSVTKSLCIHTSVSLNTMMIDGTGMCGGCRLTYNGKTKFACVDGPDFDGFKVDFHELILKENIYVEEEKHMCKIKNIL